MSAYDDMYLGTPPWEIGRPQRAVVELAEQGAFHGRVLDVGCGTGENALFLARRGLEVTGIDIAARAIELAAQKAQDVEGRAPRFRVADALALRKLNSTFDTVLDCGFFHTLGDEARAAYLRGLSVLMPPSSTLHIICFSDDEPDWGGPRRIQRKELEQLGTGWFLDALDAVRYESLISEQGAAAWRASYTFGGRGPSELQ